MPASRLGLEAVSIDDKIYAFGGKEGQPAESVTGVTEIFYVGTNQTG
jgi:hypothetical protein